MKFIHALGASVYDTSFRIGGFFLRESLRDLGTQRLLRGEVFVNRRADVRLSLLNIALRQRFAISTEMMSHCHVRG